MVILCSLIIVRAGFDDPRKAIALVQKQHGKPCECSGGQVSEAPPNSIQQVTCPGKTAYLMTNQKWKCRVTPKNLTPSGGELQNCPCNTFQDSMHSSCYTEYRQCRANNKTYYTATLLKIRSGSLNEVQILQNPNQLLQSPCRGSINQPVCWSATAPIHISDGGGPLDTKRVWTVQKRLEQIHKAMHPELQYHPLALPKVRDDLSLDARTFDILNTTFRLLQMSNFSLAQDCWLCLKLGTPTPLAIPTPSLTYSLADSLANASCQIIPPLLVQPMQFSNSSCLSSPFINDTEQIDLGAVTFTNCTSVANVSSPLCALNGSVFLCGNNMAYTYLPQNWTGLCVQASLLPDIDIIPGDEPVPIPAIDHYIHRPKRAVQFIPLLAGLGITAAFTTGATGLGVSVTQYTKLSHQLISDVQVLSGTIQDLQDQVDSLAEVVLQNRRGLDLLTAEQGGICLVLQEKCCFYANKSGIVRNKIRTLQEELQKRRESLASNPLWTGLQGFLPYLLPLLGPLLTLLLILTIGPCVFSRLMAFINDRLNVVHAMMLAQQYQALKAEEEAQD